jgi:heat shock protein HslJ
MAVVTAGASACGWNDDVDSRSATAGLPSTQQKLEAHDWALDRTNSTPPLDTGDRTVTIAFRDDEVSGSGPCNTYRGSFSVDGDHVDISDIASTLMACEPSLMDAEANYFDALESVTSADFDDDEEGLELHGDGVSLRYDSFDAEDLIVGEWDITNVASGDALAGAIIGTQPTVTFHDNGDLTVTTGCNDASGGWELRGNELEIGPLRQTNKACADPEGVMEQEAALTSAFEAATEVALTPDALTLLDADGSIVITAAKE